MTKPIDRPRVKNTWSKPPGRKRNTVEDFWANVDKNGPGGCWIWNGSRKPSGYGQMRMANVRIITHRFAYEQIKGPIPAGLQIDHLCRVRECCNPDHLEPVTIRENVLRGIGHSAQNARATHCREGHEFTPQNTRRVSGSRICITCARARQREKGRKRAELIKADPSLAPHGVLTTYSNWRCRCADCKAVWSAYMREYHQRRVESASAVRRAAA